MTVHRHNLLSNSDLLDVPELEVEAPFPSHLNQVGTFDRRTKGVLTNVYHFKRYDPTVGKAKYGFSSNRDGYHSGLAGAGD